MTRVNVGVFGSTGRMGKAVIAGIEAEFSTDAAVAASVSTRAGGLDDLATVDVIIDFSLPAGTALLVDWLHGRGQRAPSLLSGTTGLNADLLGRLMALGDATKVLYSTNFSAGIAAVATILEIAAPVLAKLGYEPVLTETHHRHKLDAPSGTAKTLLEIIGDDTQTHSIRAGEVVGRHEVTFHGAQDAIVIAHDAKDRALFARGAIDAAIWLAQLPENNARFTMQSYFKRRYLEQDASNRL